MSISRLFLLAGLFAVVLSPRTNATAGAETPGAALFPLDWVPVHETAEEIAAREARLGKIDQDFLASLQAAKESGRLDAWLRGLLPGTESRGRHAARRPKNESSGDDSDDEATNGSSVYKRSHRLLALTQFALDEGHPELKPFLVAEFRAVQKSAEKSFLEERQNDIKTAEKLAKVDGEEDDKVGKPEKIKSKKRT